MSQAILVQRAGPIVTVVLNRPEKLNALTKPMWQRLGEVFGELSADDSIRCIVLRGAGTKSFAPGNDISEFENERSNVEQARAYGRIMHATIDAIAACPHPVVAMIHGICVGGGLEIAGLADIRICGESSRFGVPIKNLGLVMAYGEMRALIDLAGRATALELLLEGRVFGAAEFAARKRVGTLCEDIAGADQRRPWLNAGESAGGLGVPLIPPVPERDQAGRIEKNPAHLRAGSTRAASSAPPSYRSAMIS